MEQNHKTEPKTCALQKKHCGGCPLLSQPYAAQLAAKQARLEKLLGRFAKVRPILGMQDPWHYRNKVISTFAAQGKGLTSGIYARGSHRVLPVESCLLQNEIADQTVLAVRAAANACRLPPFEEDRGTGLLRHCVVRVGKTSGQVLVAIVTPGKEFPGSRNFVSALRAECRKRGVDLVTVVQNINPRKTSAVLGTEEKILFGPGTITDTLCGLQFAISARSFYQVNPVQTEILYRTAIDFAGLNGTQTVIDAYCGIGTIGLCAAAKAKSVLGIELNPAAARDAAANARRNRVANARFLCADATEYMVQLAAEGVRPDVVFLDPPRAGSTPEFIAALAKMAPEKAVYVSCDPTTLARDLALFAAKGYKARAIQPVDMFPHTEHIEVVCLLSKL